MTAAASTPPVRRITPSRGWAPASLRELWSWRELFWFLLWRDVSVRYKQTVLGALWAVLQPACTMIVFTVIFGRLAGVPSDGVPYAVFSYAGLLPWLLFQNGVLASGNSLVANQQLVTKVYLPRLLLPAAAVGVAVVDFAVAATVLGVLFAMFGVLPGWTFVLAPLFVLLLFVLTVATGTLVAALNVTYRDFRYAIPFAVQLLMFCTPVVYPASLVPPAWRSLVFLNPAAGAVEGFRAAVLGTAIPWSGVAMSCGTTLLLGIVALFVFGRLERRFADVI